MIQPLRSAHRRFFLAWTIVLPGLLAGAVATRHHSFQVRERVRNVPIPGRETLRARPAGGSSASSMEALSSDWVAAPDLLVYWTPQKVVAALPAEARLLGPFRPHHRYPLPADRSGLGYLSLYSLAHQEVLSSLPVEDLR